MFCQNCNTEIPPAWSKVIAKNICPACDGFIIPETQKLIMDEVKTAIAEMSATPEELSGWLFSNFDLTKKGEIKPTEFHRPKEPVRENLKIAPNLTQDMQTKFAQNAGFDKMSAKGDWAQFIESINNINGEIYGQDAMKTVQAQEMPADELSAEDKRQILTAAAKLQGRPLTAVEAKLALEGGGNSLFLDSQGNPTSEVISDSNLINHAASLIDVEQQLPPLLQQERMKRLMKQQNFNSGGGSFRRG